MFKYLPLLLIFFLASCDFRSISPGKEIVRIGFSQCTSDDLWRITMNEELERISAVYPEIEFEIRDGKANNNKQIEDIRYFINSGVDVLIVSPNESEPITPVVEEAYSEGIPVILIDRKISSDKFTTYIGGDNYEIGKQAALYSKIIRPTGGKILEISGLIGSSPAQERSRGFTDHLDQNLFEIIGSGDGQWIETPTKQIVQNALNINNEFNIIYAHNDVMAESAYEVLVENQLQDDIIILGVDGLPGDFGGVKKVMDNKLDATFLYPTGGKEAIETALRISNAEDVPREITLETALIDENNAEIYLLQTERLISQQALLEQQQEAIDRQILRFENQQVWLFIILMILVASFVFLFFLIKAYKYIGRINRHLEQKNLSIQHQRNQILEMSNRIESYSKEKIDFFTFISHEFRTPITIVNSLLYRVKNHKKGVSNSQLSIIESNMTRLNSLVDQVLDFRKFEENKVEIINEPLNLEQCVPPLIDGFYHATNKSISWKLDYELSPFVLFDKDKLEKVLTNLISNALKFTDDYGHVKIDLFVSNNSLTINVKDNGVGIPSDKLEDVFKPFFSSKHTDARFYAKGTGLGLSLVKQIVDLYKGTIEVESTIGVGTTFSCKIPLKVMEANFHQEFVNTIDNQNEFNIELDSSHGLIEEKIISEKALKTKILLVEDNVGLNEELKHVFSEAGYEIKSEFDGDKGIECAITFKPDLIITDLIMPKVSGLEVASTLKKDPNFGNVPILMLTAMTDNEMKRRGYQAGVDDYITKPFEPELLLAKVENVLKTQQKLVQSVKNNNVFLIEDSNKILSDIEQDFLTKLTKIIQHEIQNPDFNVNQLADLMLMSRITLYNKVKALIEVTPVELIKKTRVGFARKLIEETEYSISEIAFKCGFQNSSYFTKVFKNEFSLTPTQYAKEHRKMAVS